MNIKKVWHTAHAWANHHEWLFLLWTVLILLRLPNLVEPYWYGDEAIYLTIGTAMRHGLKLYAETVDHKTPLIYYLAMVPNQLSFRFLMIGWMVVTTGFFHSLARRFFTERLAFAAGLLFVLLTSLPSFEGHIPNGELFVMGFVITGLWMLAKTAWFARLIEPRSEKAKKHLTHKDFMSIGLAGVFASLGILTKVPALLDMGVIGALFLFATVASLRKAHWKHQVGELFSSWATFALGVAIPILFSIVYYMLRGTLQDYAQFGLLYNFHYSGSYTPSFSFAFLSTLFTLPVKALILIATFFASIVMTFWKRTQAPAIWTVFWTWAALFAALLSNRPYPHYFQQVVPPFTLMAVFFLSRTTDWKSKAFILKTGVISYLILVALQFRPYSIGEYYSKYAKLITGQWSREQYLHSFHGFVEQNERLTAIIQDGSTQQDRIFIWGTNPMLYARSQRSPASKFTVAFHIHDLKVYAQTMDEIRQNKPQFIIIMKEERELPGLDEYLDEHYVFSTETLDMILYRRSSLTSLQLIQ